MERLTRRCEEALNDEMTEFKKFIEIALEEKKKTKGGYSQSVYDIYEDEELYQMADKLADYEDTEEQGLLLRLPCKVGDTVYLIAHITCESRKKPLKCTVDEFTIDHKNSCYAVLNGCANYYALRRFKAINIRDFGRIVFFTREAAEQALSKIQEGN